MPGVITEPDYAASRFVDGIEREVTMAFKGDLISASLSDVLQMLYHNGKEGTLRVMGPDLLKSIFCSRDGITLLNADIMDKQCFGDALEAMGLADTKEVEKAVKKAKAKQPLGKSFIKAGIVDEEMVNRILKHHITEEIYGLFDLTSGEFEFFEGSDGDISWQKDRLPVIPVGTVLLESARRMDEWQHISKDIGNLDNIFMKNPGHEEEEDPEGLSVLEFVNGRRSVRQIADCLLITPIQVGKSMVGLVERERIRPLDKEEFLALARELIETKEIEDVGTLLQQLKPNLKNIIAEDIDVSLLADLYEKEGDRKTATGLLLEKADHTRSGESEEDGSPYLEQALKINPKDMRVLMELADSCDEKGDKEGRIRHLIALVDAYLKAEQFDRAFKEFTEILDAGVTDTFVLENFPKFPDDLVEGGEREFLEELVIDNMPDFLVEAENKQGAVEFLENVIHKHSDKFVPRQVAALYMQIIRTEASEEVSTTSEAEIS